VSLSTSVSVGTSVALASSASTGSSSGNNGSRVTRGTQQLPHHDSSRGLGWIHVRTGTLCGTLCDCYITQNVISLLSASSDSHQSPPPSPGVVPVANSARQTSAAGATDTPTSSHVTTTATTTTTTSVRAGGGSHVRAPSTPATTNARTQFVDDELPDDDDRFGLDVGPRRSSNPVHVRHTGVRDRE
jgi:hypothetical protein